MTADKPDGVRNYAVNKHIIVLDFQEYFSTNTTMVIFLSALRSGKPTFQVAHVLTLDTAKGQA